jgi:hypothetical protein
MRTRIAALRLVRHRELSRCRFVTQVSHGSVGAEHGSGMPRDEPSREDAERAMRRLLREHDLPQPDDVLDHEDGGIVCLWHEPKVAIVVDLEPRAA